MDDLEIHEPAIPSSDPAPDEPADEPSPSEKLLTQAEVGRLLAAERKRVREATLKDLKSKPKQESSGRVPTSELQGQIDAMRLELGFERAVRRYGLQDRQVETLRSLAAAAKPDDLDQWLGSTVEDLGLKSPPNGEPARPAAQPSPSPTHPPASDRGGAAPTSDGLAADSPLRWSQSDVQRIIDGEDSFEAGVQKVRKMFMAGLRNVSVEFPRGPK